jgi:hypothetical protein
LYQGLTSVGPKIPTSILNIRLRGEAAFKSSLQEKYESTPLHASPHPYQGPTGEPTRPVSRGPQKSHKIFRIPAHAAKPRLNPRRVPVTA